MNVGDSRFSVSRTPRHCRRWWEILTLKKGRMLPGHGCPELAVYWRKKYRKKKRCAGAQSEYFQGQQAQLSGAAPCGADTGREVFYFTSL